MLTTKDIQTITLILRNSEERIIYRVEEKIEIKLHQLEERLTEYMQQQLQQTEERIILDFGNFMHDNVLPQLEEKADKQDVFRLEQKLDHFITQTINLQNTKQIIS